MKQFVILAAFVAAVTAIRYDGYQVMQVGPVHDTEKLKYVVSLIDDDGRIREVVLLNENYGANQPVSLAVSPRAFNRVSAALLREDISFNVTNRDLQKSFDESKAANDAETTRWMKSGMKGAPTSYLRYADQVSWLQSIAASTAIASTFSIGKTVGERDTIGIAINQGRDDLPAIWIDAQLHAGEWLTSATALYIIEQILIGTSADAVRMRMNYRWYIVPNANPDGYEYSYLTDRLWRKNRAPIPGSVCFGTDLNKNFPEDWGGRGSSFYSCDDAFIGLFAFSELETTNIGDYLTSIAPFTNVMFSLHSYGKYWLLPWGGKTSTRPADYDELMNVGFLASDAIRRVNGLSFAVGTPNALYNNDIAAGCTIDWAKAQLNITYAYSPELRPDAGVLDGIEIPPSNITPSGAEIFAAVVATVTNARHKV